MAKKRKGIPGLSFSWKKASGITKAKKAVARKTGIPTTKSGRQRKVGKALGCCIPFVILLIGFGTLLIGIAQLTEYFFI